MGDPPLTPARLLFYALLLPMLTAATIDVKSNGAKGDGRTPDREAIQGAIEAASAAGGGTVIFPAGTYVTGSMRLRSNLTLQFERGRAARGVGGPGGVRCGRSRTSGTSFRISATATFTTA